MRIPFGRPPAAGLLMVLLLAAGGGAAAQDKAVPGRLLGHAILPAETVLKPPGDAPPLVRSVGKFAGPDGQRVESPGTLTTRTGVTLPVRGQPLQGISSLRTAGDGSYWALADNGMGARGNSADSLLAVHRLRPDWDTGTVRHLGTVWLTDPDRRMPWPITLEGAERRYLTGADLDPESLVVDEDGFWIGDEFGPWLLRFDSRGRLVGLWDTVVDTRVIRSPDHPAVQLPATPDGSPRFEIARSRGIEGLTASGDGRHLYALLEGPVWREGKPETFADGKPRLRLLEFDTQAGGGGAWSGRSWTYTLEHERNAIGAFTWLDDQRALVIERDGGEGDAARACPDGQSSAPADGAAAPATDCFPRPARFKRIYLVTRADVKEGGALRKLGHVDLLAIQDPDGRARTGTAREGRFTFPFVTTESLELAGGDRIVIANDNNFPFSTGREPNRPDNTEFILLSVPELLKLR